MEFPFLRFVAFALATSATPGPNNVMVAASAAHFGVRRTLPHMLGIAIGFGVMVIAAGIGLAAPIAHYQRAQIVMRLIGAAWLLVIAAKISVAGPPGVGARRAPLGFFGAAAFQWINPKAWVLVLGMASAWIVGQDAIFARVSIMAAVFAVACLPCALLWAAIGVGAAPLLATPWRLRAFNVTMAGLLVLSLVPVFLEE